MTLASANNTSAGFASISMLFFLAGCLGYSYEKMIYVNIPWIQISNSKMQAYFALRNVYIQVPHSDTEYSYASTACNDDFCDVCNENGFDSFQLVVVATGFSAVVFAQCKSLSTDKNIWLQLSSILSAFMASGAAALALWLVMVPCYHAIDDETDYSLSWGIGAILVAAGFGFMGIVTIIQFLSAAFCKV